MKEEWRQVAGYEGLYMISNLGRVKSLPRLVKRSIGGSYTTKERVLKGGTTCYKKRKTGYRFVILSKDNKSKNFYVHKLVAQAFITNNKNKSQVNHIDGNKLNNTVTNLEWCTPLENSRHAIAHNLVPKGQDLSYSKLTLAQVNYIREQILNSYYRGMQKDLANKFNVSTATISLIKNNINWSV